MTFQPVIPAAGIAGWTLLKATYDRQFEAFSKAPQLQRGSAYFAENIGGVTSAAELLDDRRLLSVALGAFGLSEDINKRAFLEKILQEGTEADDALANRLKDERYVRFSEAFGFGPGQSLQTGNSSAMADIAFTGRVQAFEAAVGEQDETMRTALFAEREVVLLAREDGSVNTKWFNVMAQPALRDMFEVALNLPSSLSQIDLDQQLETFKSRARAVFGSDDLAIFAEPEALDDLVKTYLAKAQIKSFAAANSPASNALLLLQSARGFSA